MYLTDLTDAQKEYLKGTILVDNWRSKYDFFLILYRSEERRVGKECRL